MLHPLPHITPAAPPYVGQPLSAGGGELQCHRESIWDVTVYRRYQLIVHIV